ncbi:MAG: hypothetical protein RI897_111 [Verrucomicrobiota bacterium]
MNRREFAAQLAMAGLGFGGAVMGQERGERPRVAGGVEVLNPRCRVPVGIIIDDSTCLVNLNRFAMPQFDEAWGGTNPVYHRDWKSWPVEIPDSFVRKFAEWSLSAGVKGKYSIVPYPACVGRLDRVLPGWGRRELDDSIRLVRELITPNWDIHPEMVTHTRVIDVRTGHPYPDSGKAFMENWDWTTGRGREELGEYLAYALRILRNVDLPCEGVTTPGGFGSQARPALAGAVLDSVREVYGAEVPHYFRDLYDAGGVSVAPRVELAAGLDGDSPRCVVSIVGCTGDWTGGWDCTEPEGVDRFISADLGSGRLVEVIGRGEPAMMVCHWTGVYWNGEELGLKVFQEVERRLRARFADEIVWMKTGELARYWAARQLTGVSAGSAEVGLMAPFACRDFTLSLPVGGGGGFWLDSGGGQIRLREVGFRQHLVAGTWWSGEEEGRAVVCVDLQRGVNRIRAGV